jgi:hypothetical protein
MSKTVVLKSVAVLSFVISAVFTVKLMTSGTDGLMAYWLTFGMAIIFEVVKCGFFYKSLTDRKLNFGIRVTIGSLAVILFCCSIFASAGYISNNANQNKNTSVKNSTEYKQLEEGRNINKDMYNQKKAEIESLQLNKQKVISDMERIRDSYPKSYITAKENMTKDILSKSQQLQKEIDIKNAELDNVSNKINVPLDVSKLNVLDTTGYSGLFKIVAENLNKLESFKNSPLSPAELEMYFFIFLGIVFEFVAIMSVYLAQIEECAQGIKVEVRSEPKKIELEPEHIVKPDARVIPLERKEVRAIGFNTDKEKEIDRKDWNKYVQYMYANAKNNVSPGYKHICSKVGIIEETGRKIKGALEQNEVIQTLGNRSIIIKGIDEIK